MFKVNEYFGGKVMSMGFEAPEGPATIGIMASGEYEFGTSRTEHMKVVSGRLLARLPGETAFREYREGETFVVPPNAKFQVQAPVETAYLCLYK